MSQTSRQSSTHRSVRNAGSEQRTGLPHSSGGSIRAGSVHNNDGAATARPASRSGVRELSGTERPGSRTSVRGEPQEPSGTERPPSRTSVHGQPQEPSGAGVAPSGRHKWWRDFMGWAPPEKKPLTAPWIFCLYMGTFMASMNATLLVNIATKVAADIKDVESLSLITFPFHIAEGSLGLLAIAASNIWGRKAMFQWSLLLMAFGTTLCCFGRYFWVLVVIGRALSGVANGLISWTPHFMANDAQGTSGANYAFALLYGGFAAAQAGTAIGGIVGGGLAETVGWEWGFVLIASLAGGLFVLSGIFVKDTVCERPSWTQLDYLGGLLLFLLLGAGLTVSDLGSMYEWRGPAVIGLFVIIACSGICLAIWETRLNRKQGRDLRHRRRLVDETDGRRQGGLLARMSMSMHRDRHDRSHHQDNPATTTIELPEFAPRLGGQETRLPSIRRASNGRNRIIARFAAWYPIPILSFVNMNLHSYLALGGAFCLIFAQGIITYYFPIFLQIRGLDRRTIGLLTAIPAGLCSFILAYRFLDKLQEHSTKGDADEFPPVERLANCNSDTFNEGGRWQRKHVVLGWTVVVLGINVLMTASARQATWPIWAIMLIYSSYDLIYGCFLIIATSSYYFLASAAQAHRHFDPIYPRRKSLEHNYEIDIVLGNHDNARLRKGAIDALNRTHQNAMNSATSNNQTLYQAVSGVSFAISGPVAGVIYNQRLRDELNNRLPGQDALIERLRGDVEDLFLLTGPGAEAASTAFLRTIMVILAVAAGALATAGIIFGVGVTFHSPWTQKNIKKNTRDDLYFNHGDREAYTVVGHVQRFKEIMRWLPGAMRKGLLRLCWKVICWRKRRVHSEVAPQG